MQTEVHFQCHFLQACPIQSEITSFFCFAIRKTGFNVWHKGFGTCNFHLLLHRAHHFIKVVCVLDIKIIRHRVKYAPACFQEVLLHFVWWYQSYMRICQLKGHSGCNSFIGTSLSSAQNAFVFLVGLGLKIGAYLSFSKMAFSSAVKSLSVQILMLINWSPLPYSCTEGSPMSFSRKILPAYLGGVGIFL